MTDIIKAIFPIFTIIIAVLLTNIPVINNNFYLDLAIPLILFWIIHFPRSMWFIYLFFLGFVADTMTNTILGLHSFTYLMIWCWVLYFRRKGIMNKLIGINFVSFVVVTFSYLTYGLIAYLNSSLQIFELLLGGIIIFIISILFNIFLMIKNIR